MKNLIEHYDTLKSQIAARALWYAHCLMHRDDYYRRTKYAKQAERLIKEDAEWLGSVRSLYIDIRHNVAIAIIENDGEITIHRAQGCAENEEDNNGGQLKWKRIATASERCYREYDFQDD